MNCVVDTVQYRENIISLWNECFGDSREYIEFFLDNCPDKLCLGYIENNRLCSMLFLLNGEINGFSAKYIYAACTCKCFRGRGLMGSLIGYAKEYAVSRNIDFIFLVPGEESLYSYYSRFGFVPKMQRSEIVLNSKESSFIPQKTTDIGFVTELRLKLLSKLDRFAFDKETTEYTIKEFLYTGGEIYYSDKEDEFLAFAVKNGCDVLIKELLIDYDGNLTKNLYLLKKLNAENVYIRTPLVYNSRDNRNKSTKCGMVYPVSDKAKQLINSNITFYAGMYLD